VKLDIISLDVPRFNAILSVDSAGNIVLPTENRRDFRDLLKYIIRIEFLPKPF
jgi:hypothetical protein